MTFELPEIFDGAARLAVLGDDLFDDVGYRLEAFGLVERLPRPHLQDVVPRPRLLLGGGGEDVLVALGGDVVDGDLDLLLGRPIVTELGQGVVGAGYPVVPETHAELAGGEGSPHVGRGDQRTRGESGLTEKFATR